MKRTMKRWVSMGLTATMSVTLLAACGDKEEVIAPSSSGDQPKTAAEVYPENGLPKNEKVSLKYGFFQGGNGRVGAELAIKTFMEKYPNVTIELTASPDIASILSTKISANSDKDMFDMFNRQPSGGVVALAEAGKLEVLDDLWDHKLPDMPDKVLKEMVIDGLYGSANRINGKSYEIPSMSSFGGLFFNKKLFEKNNWNQNPKTWSEFNDLLAQIKAAGVAPITFPGIHPTYHDWAFGNAKTFELADMKGGFDAFFKNFETYTNEYSSPEVIELWNRVYELGKKGYFSEGLPALTHTQAQMLVIQGAAAMVSTGSHVEGEMKESAPKDFEWGFMGVPFVEKAGQTIWVKTSTTNGHFIWAAKPDLNKKWAKEFIMWNMNMNLQQFTAEQGALPVRKDLIADPQRADKMLTSHKAILKYLVDNKARSVKASRTVSLSDASFKQATKIMDEATPKIFIGKQDPAPVLAEADKLIRKALEANKK